MQDNMLTGLANAVCLTGTLCLMEDIHQSVVLGKGFQYEGR